MNNSSSGVAKGGAWPGTCPANSHMLINACTPFFYERHEEELV